MGYPSFKYKNASAEDLSYIGQRLRDIREELVELDQQRSGVSQNESMFARKNLADYFELNYHTYTNMEKGVFSHNTFKIILFFYQLGYNPNWILIEDNEFINKKNLDENFSTKADVKEDFKVLKNTIDAAMNEFKTKL